MRTKIELSAELAAMLGALSERDRAKLLALLRVLNLQWGMGHDATGCGYTVDRGFALKDYVRYVAITASTERTTTMAMFTQAELYMLVNLATEPLWLSLADLQGANFQAANLSGANLDGTNLSGANLQEANLTRANLNGANLSGANLARANLTGADLEKVDFTGAVLARVNLSGANLQDANLTKAYLDGANLSGANLWAANLSGANLTGADLDAANLSGTEYTKETIWPDGFDPEKVGARLG